MPETNLRWWTLRRELLTRLIRDTGAPRPQFAVKVPIGCQFPNSIDRGFRRTPRCYETAFTTTSNGDRSIHPSIHVFSLHVEPLVPLCFHRISYIRYLLLSSTLLPEYLYFSPIPVFIYIRGEATKEIIWVIILKTILTYFNITMSQLITIWYGDNQSCIKI